MSATGARSQRVPRPFNLRRWFAAAGLVSIGLISVISALLLSRFLTERMLHQEGVLAMEFIQSVVIVQQTAAFLGGAEPEDTRALEETFRHIASMPDVLRANVYSRDRRVIWSSDPALIGSRFKDNPELDGALAGRLVVHGGERHDPEHWKAEHVKLKSDIEYFVEIYSPVRGPGSDGIVGVVELYKQPKALFEAVRDGERLVWLGAAGAGAVIYLALFGMVRRADNLIRAQQERLVESETLAALGEMGSAVAHGIRNPLASIRSSAELLADGAPEHIRETADDIMAEVDRLEYWVRELLTYSRPGPDQREPVELGAIILGSITSFERELERREIASTARLPESLPAVRADPALMGQVFNNLIANAMEAIGQGGAIEVSAHAAQDGRVVIRVSDTGAGMTAEQLARVFKPFYTTKSKGLGVGLALSKRIVERIGGRIALASEPGRGTVVELTLPVV